MSDLLKVQTFGRITKVNAATQTVEGIGADETPDTENEIFDYEGSKPYIEAWSTKQADTTKSAGQAVSYGNIRGQHDAKKAAGRIAEPIHFDDRGKAVLLSTKIVDKDEFQKCLDGVYTGFSVKGRSVKKWRDGGFTRYIVDPVEFSLVDLPCNPNATFTCVKADGAEEEREFADAEEITKRKFSEQRRKELADSGKALPDGSFPIENKEDLEHAVRAIGRAKNPAAAKKHIIARAKELGATDTLPADWPGSKEKAAGSSEEIVEVQGVRRFHNEPVNEFVERAVSTLVSKAAEPPKPAAQEKSMKTEQEIQKAAASEKMKAARKAFNDVGACVGGYCDHSDASKCMEKAAEAHKHIAAAFSDDEAGDGDEAEKAAKAAKDKEEKKDAEDGDAAKSKDKKKSDDKKDEGEEEKEKAAGSKSELDEVKEGLATLAKMVEKMAEQPGAQRNKPVVNGTVVEKKNDVSKAAGSDDKDKAADIDPSDPERVEKGIKRIYSGELETVKL